MNSDWQNSFTSNAEASLYMYQKGLYTDCSFLVGQGDNQKLFKAHKNILVGVSPVFEKMLFGDVAENSGRIEVTDIEPNIFKKFLSIIYTEEVFFDSFSEACNLLYTASKYLVQRIIGPCIDFIKANVTSSSAAEAYEFLSLFGHEEAAAECKKLIIRDTSAVINSETFLNIEKQTLIMILNEDCLGVNSEFELYNAAVRWLDAEVERKGIVEEKEKETLQSEILCSLRFLSMRAEEFVQGPAYNSFLSQAEALAIVTNILDPKTTNANIPEKISSKKREFSPKIGLPFNWKELMFRAANTGYVKELEELRLAGADITVKDDLGYSLLHLAAGWGRVDVVRWLIKNGLDVNAHNNYLGKTVLHFAVVGGNLEVVRLVLESGAIPTIREKNGQTSKLLAVRLGNNAARELIQEYECTAS